MRKLTSATIQGIETINYVFATLPDTASLEEVDKTLGLSVEPPPDTGYTTQVRDFIRAFTVDEAPKAYDKTNRGDCIAVCNIVTDYLISGSPDIVWKLTKVALESGRLSFHLRRTNGQSILISTDGSHLINGLKLAFNHADQSLTMTSCHNTVSLTYDHPLFQEKITLKRHPDLHSHPWYRTSYESNIW